MSSVDRFRAFPLPALRDSELTNSGFDVLVAKCQFHNDTGSKYWEKRATVKMLAQYTSLSEGRIRELLPDLSALGYLSFERHGQQIVNIQWGDREDVQDSVKRRDVWVRLPILVLEDTSLKPHQRRAYLAIVHYAFEHGEPFYLSARVLGGLVGVEYQTAAKTLKSLRDRGLVDYHQAREGDPVSPMFLPPMEDVYPNAEAAKEANERTRSATDKTKGTAATPEGKTMHAKSLVDTFHNRVLQANAELPDSSSRTTAGLVHRKALGQNISSWIRDDRVPPYVVREMIEVFVEDTRLLMRPKPAWKTFINRRATLEQQARRRLGAEYETTVVAPSTPDLGWSESAEMQKARLEELRQRAMKHRTED